MSQQEDKYLVLESEDSLKARALDYNDGGKIGIYLRKSIKTNDDLGLAYTPGVGAACMEIVKDPAAAYKYTSKWNSIAVVTDGTAVLGFGDIGALASIPVMEGKAALFKTFADVDAWPVPLDNMRVDGMYSRTDIEKVICATTAIAPQYGGINLEDIAAPACFEVEARLKQLLDIPVFHDDQHGTAIVVVAALQNYLKISNKKVEDLKTVILGAGAAGMSIANLMRHYGVKDILMCDSKGVIHAGRDNLNKWKQQYAIKTDARTPIDAFAGADVFIGVSKPGIVTPDMIKSMNYMPAVFPMANPVCEIMPDEVMKCRDDAIISTGRSDFPNQVNNVLAFPFIFRAALDVQASDINEDMKIAAANAIAGLARAEVPEEVINAYGISSLEFSKDYIIPKPLDPRFLATVSTAVAEAAIRSGVARKEIDLEEYNKTLKNK